MTEQSEDGAIPRPRVHFDDYFVSPAPRLEPPVAKRLGSANRVGAGHIASDGQVLQSAWTPGSAPHFGSTSAVVGPRHVGSSRAWLAAFVAVAVVVAIAVVHLSGRTASAVGGGDGLFGTATAHPPEHQFPDPTRIFPAVAQVPGTGGYTVLNEHAGRPVGWDPCEPVHFVVRDANAIPGGRALLDRAMAEVSKDTGLYFMDDGATGETPTAKRNPYQPAQYGQNWVPVLIAWSNPAEFPALAGDVIGLASPVAVGGRDARIVSGEVVFDAPELQRVEALPDGSTYAYDVMLHELGHLVGLGHIADPSQIMNPETVRPLPGYGTGDLRGLAVLGSGRCFTKG